jgi:hypothetical protein
METSATIMAKYSESMTARGHLVERIPLSIYLNQIRLGCKHVAPGRCCPH